MPVTLRCSALVSQQDRVKSTLFNCWLHAAPGQLPLWGRRIMVTAPRQYAGRLAARLAAAGARVVTMPCIAIQRLEEPEQLQVSFSSGGQQMCAADEAVQWYLWTPWDSLCIKAGLLAGHATQHTCHCCMHDCWSYIGAGVFTAVTCNPIGAGRGAVQPGQLSAHRTHLPQCDCGHVAAPRRLAQRHQPRQRCHRHCWQRRRRQQQQWQQRRRQQWQQ
jgi:hypothetical protein